MWINIMNLLTLLAIILLLLFTGIGFLAYLKERHTWKSIEVKANESGIKTLED